MSASVIVREGNVRLRVMANPKTLRGRRFVDWEFRWRDGAGRRRRIKRARKKDAIAEARKIAQDLAAGRSAELSSADVASFRAGIVNLYGCGTTIEAATAEYAEARRRLGGAGSVLEAAAFFARHHPTVRSNKGVADVVSELLAAKRAAVGDRHLSDLASRLGRLGREVRCAVGDLSAPLMTEWLKNIKGSSRTRLNYRGALSNFVAFSIEKKYLPKNFAGMSEVEAPRLDDSEIEIYTPDEMARLLAKAPEALAPALAIGAFAGLRSAELERLDWSEINFHSGFIEVTAKKAKTKSRRLVPLLDNLRSLLYPLAKRSGKVWHAGHAWFYECQRTTAVEAGLEWRRNALRHSFISYRLAAIQDVNQVALEAGNSPRMIFEHYRELVTPSEAVAWFSVSPQFTIVRDQKICPLFAPSDDSNAKKAQKVGDPNGNRTR